MRTWELTKDTWYDYARSLDSEDGWPNGLSGDPIRVIELEPVLDLLEKLIVQGRKVNRGHADALELRPGIALLRTHGRLDG